MATCAGPGRARQLILAGLLLTACFGAWSAEDDKAVAASTSDSFRLDVRKIFSPEEVAALCEQHKEALGDGIDRCRQRRPAFIASHALEPEKAAYRAVITIPDKTELQQGDVIEMRGHFGPPARLEFSRRVCAVADPDYGDCAKDPKRGGSSGRVNPDTGIGEIE